MRIRKPSDLILSHLYFVATLTIIVFCIYGQALQLPFIQDDWAFMSNMLNTNYLDSLSRYFHFENRLFYRPLARSYLLGMHHIFDSNPLPFHLFALIIHISNALLVALILNFILKDKLVSYLSSLLYASAISVHLDPLAWTVGAYDVFGVFFWLAGLLLYVKRHIFSAAIFYACGCLFKESIILLPLLLLTYSVLMESNLFNKNSALTIIKKILPFIPVSIVIILIKLSGKPVISLPSSHPYVIDIFGPHIAENLSLYFTFFAQSLIPADYLYQQRTFCTIAVVLFLLYGLMAFTHQDQTAKHKEFVFLTCWLVIGLLPVLFLPNHTYRYYASYSLPAYIGLIFLTLKIIAEHFSVKNNFFMILLVSLALLSITGSAIQGNKIYSEKMKQKTLSEHSNLLIRNGAIVDLVYEGLMQHTPVIPKGSIIVFGGLHIWAFDKNHGPRTWFKDKTLRVFDLRDLSYQKGSWFITNPTNNQVALYTGSRKRKIKIDAGRLFVFEYSEDKLKPIELNMLKKRFISN